MLKKLLPYLGQYKKYAILAPVFVVFEVACELVLPLLMADIIDVGIAAGDTGYILRKGGLMVALAALAMFFGGMSAKFSAVGSQGFGANLRQGMFHKVQEFSFGDIDRFSSASLITRMTNDVNNLQMMIAMGLRILTRSPVMLFAALGVAIYINARLSLILIVTIPLLSLAVGLLMKMCHKLFAVMQQKIDAVNETVQENLIAIRVVKAFVREGFEKTKFKKVNDEFTAAGLNVVMRIIFMQPIMMLAFYGATLAVIWFGGKIVTAGGMQVGDLVSFINYIVYILMSVLMVALSLLQLTRAMACSRRICEVLDTEPAIEDGDCTQLPPQKGRVEFQNASFRYQTAGTGDNVLESLSFTVESGEFAAIVGGTGTGKSSLVHLIPRFYDVTEGAVLVDGLNVKDYPLEGLRDRIGMVLQNNILFSGTIRENLLWGKEGATEDELIAATKDACAYDFIMSFPDGFDTYLEQGGVNVSGGQKQRLCIARAMLRRPAILILDDSTSAVDSATEASIRRSFKENLAGTTVIIIAQRISSVRDADKIIVLDDGRVNGVGTHEQLMEHNTIYQEIYRSQQEGGLE